MKGSRWCGSDNTISNNKQFEMVSFNIDPQWCGLLFSVYCHHERGGSFLPGPDAFAYSVAGPPLDVDLIAWAGSFGFEICSLSSTCELIFESVKATGVLIFLGVGGLICYKLLNVCWPCKSKSLDSPRNESINGQGECALEHIKGEYFGPSNLPEESTTANGDAYNQNILGYTTTSRSPINDASSTSCGEESHNTDDSNSIPCDTLSPLHYMSRRHKNAIKSSWNKYHPTSRSGWLVTRIANMLKSSNKQIPPSSEPDLLSNLDLPSTTHSRMTRDESYDSLGFSRHMPRDGSFDSTCSDLSLDFSLPEIIEDTNTIVSLDKLQQEIDSLKSNCLIMDEEFETIKCNRNFPGMSSLMKAKSSRSSLGNQNASTDSESISDSLKQEKARACFAGLYSLTAMKNSTSSELSDSFPARGSLGSAESLDWDSPKTAASPSKYYSNDLDQTSKSSSKDSEDTRTVKFRLGELCEDLEEGLTADNEGKTVIKKAKVKRQNSDRKISMGGSDDELMEKLEWDEEDLTEFPVGLSTLEASEDVEMGVAMKDASPSMERSTKMDISGFSSQMTDSVSTQAPWTCWSSEESGFMEWDETACDQQRSANGNSWIQPPWNGSQSSSCAISELSTPANEDPPSSQEFNQSSSLQNIGPKVNVLQYAANEWQGQTENSQTILKGYTEIPKLLHVSYLRRIRGDNYCAIRAALFQTLVQGLPISSGAKTYQFLSSIIDQSDNHWLRDWSFANRLDYHGTNVLLGMESCLQSLDSTVSLLTSVASTDRQDSLAHLLNTEPSLDLHLVEGIKLQMLHKAIELHDINTSGAGDIPLFAVLMFARDSSETPRDFMNNHLHQVGDTGGLEQVEMFLLGYTLGVTLRVVRPKAYHTEDFISNYPDWNTGVWPQVLLIAEDDRHYNILVN